MSSAARGGPAKGLLRKAWDAVGDYILRKECVGTDKHGNMYYRCACSILAMHVAWHTISHASALHAQLSIQFTHLCAAMSHQAYSCASMHAPVHTSSDHAIFYGNFQVELAAPPNQAARANWPACMRLHPCAQVL